jgi:hypothetical protein
MRTRLRVKRDKTDHKKVRVGYRSARYSWTMLMIELTKDQ